MKESQGFKKIFYYIGRIILLAIVLWMVLWAYDAVNNKRYVSRIVTPDKDQYDVIAFGDSLVEGLGAAQLNGFVSIIESRLGITILNQGHRGDETADLLKRIDADVFTYHPKVVILVIGGNDAIHLVPESEFLANTESLFKQLSERGIVTIFGEVTDNVLYANRNKQLRALADKYGIVYVPQLMQGVFWTITNKFDPLHPDDAGYVKMADRIIPYLQAILVQNTPEAITH
ncbi:MAG: GDSL-type esterase/lipase family protein [bacterium]